MSYSYPEIKRFAGLYLQANSLGVPDGALEQAQNIVISKDGRITKRRGFYLYFDPLATVLNTTSTYQNTLLGIFSNKVSYFTDSGSAPNLVGTNTDLTGETVSITGGRYSRHVEQNKNFYFTTDNGVLKLEAFNSKVFKSGGPPALDLGGTFSASNGVIVGDSVVGWRVVFGRRDSNGNLLLGSPSDILTLGNLKSLAAPWSRTGNVTTVGIANHNLSPGMAVIISNGTGTAPPTGTFIVTAIVDANNFQFANTAADSTGTLDLTTTRAVRLEFSIPSDINSVADAYFFQVYRTLAFLNASSATDATPVQQYLLIDEVALTAAQITAGFVLYDDTADESLITFNPELYTDENSQEGELQANARAPLSADMTLYKEHIIYGNATTLQILNMQIVDTSQIANGDFIEIKIGATTIRYVARSGTSNLRTSASSVSGTTTITVTSASHGLLTGDTIYVSNVTGSVPEGVYTLTGAAANTFTFTSTAHSATALDFEGIQDISGHYIFKLDNTSGSIAAQFRNTAEGIVRAINRNPASLTYANYTSLASDTPGKFRLMSKNFGSPIFVRANTAMVGSAFSPVLPASFSSGTQVFSQNDSLPNAFFFSKVGEPEAVPIVNFLTVGASNKAILRVVALRDSLIVIKEDGVFRVTGDSASSFFVTILDNTVFCLAPNSLAVINNQIVFLSNQGVCLVTESAVQIISRKIEDVISPILGNSNLAAQTAGLAYESERLYFLSTMSPQSNTADTVYVYNILNDAWTTWDTVFTSGSLGLSDTLYLVTSQGKLAKERKNQSRFDYCDQQYPVTVVSVAGSNLSAILNTSSIVPQVGDAIIKSNVINIIATVSVSGSHYAVTFNRQSNIAAADNLNLYSRITSTIRTAPVHGGLIGRFKQFAQMQVHFRNNAISAMTVSFSGTYVGGSESVDWVSEQQDGGWGFSPWGFFPWGQAQSINLIFSTQPAAIMRLYIPAFQQRVTFIQPVFVHNQATESLDIQALAFSVRAYGERVSR